ncbi:protein DJ-1 homolog D isoform X1 [Lactuca sativa]|nr:protein DJ-1 homolog D isoform X1 [Lactuca sativa]
MANLGCPKKILMLCGDYMEDLEAIVPFQALQAYGLSVDAVCPDKKCGDICRTVLYRVSPHQTFSEDRGHNFTLNATFDKIDVCSYDGLVIPGARAPEYLATYESVVEIAKHFARTGKPIASICHGSLILAAGGVLKGRTLTAFPTLGPVLVTAGANWVQPETMASCFVDGNLITGASYEGHAEYIGHFIKALGGTVTGFNKRILFLCGDYMEDYEIYVPFQSFQALGCHVDSISSKIKKGDRCYTAIHEFEGDQNFSEKNGHEFKITATFEDIDASSYDGLVIPGGRGPEYMALDQDVIKLVKYFMDARKPVASISYGQQILAAADVLKGKKCTAYPAAKLHVVLAGATWLEPHSMHRCFTDGNLVTGVAWPGHPQFIAQFMEVLGVKVCF